MKNLIVLLLVIANITLFAQDQKQVKSEPTILDSISKQDRNNYELELRQWISTQNQIVLKYESVKIKPVQVEIIETGEKYVLKELTRLSAKSEPTRVYSEALLIQWAEQKEKAKKEKK